MSMIHDINKLALGLRTAYNDLLKQQNPSYRTLREQFLRQFKEVFPKSNPTLQSYRKELNLYQKTTEYLRLSLEDQQVTLEQITFLKKILTQLKQTNELDALLMEQKSLMMRIKELESENITSNSKQKKLLPLISDHKRSITEHIHQIVKWHNAFNETLNSKFKVQKKDDEFKFPTSFDDNCNYTKHLHELAQVLDGQKISINSERTWNSVTAIKLQQELLSISLGISSANIKELINSTEETQTKHDAALAIQQDIEAAIKDFYLFLANQYYPDQLELKQTEFININKEQVELIQKVENFELSGEKKAELEEEIDKKNNPFSEDRSIQKLIDNHSPSVSQSLVGFGLQLAGNIIDTSVQQDQLTETAKENVRIVEYLTLKKQLTSNKIQLLNTSVKIKNLENFIATQKQLNCQAKPVEELQQTAIKLYNQAIIILNLTKQPIEDKTQNLRLLLELFDNLIPLRDKLQSDVTQLALKQKNLDQLTNSNSLINKEVTGFGLTADAIHSHSLLTIDRIERYLKDENGITSPTKIQISEQATYLATTQQADLEQLIAIEGRVKKCQAKLANLNQLEDDYTQCNDSLLSKQKELMQLTQQQEQQHTILTEQHLHAELLTIGNIISQLKTITLTPNTEIKLLALSELPQHEISTIACANDNLMEIIESDDAELEIDTKQLFIAKLNSYQIHDSEESSENIRQYINWYQKLYQEAHSLLEKLHLNDSDDNQISIQIINLFHDLHHDMIVTKVDVLRAYQEIAPMNEGLNFGENLSTLLQLKPTFLIEEAIGKSNINFNLSIDSPAINAFYHAVIDLSNETNSLAEDSIIKPLATNAYRIICHAGMLALKGENHSDSMENMKDDPHYQPLSEHQNIWGKFVTALAKFTTFISNFFTRDNQDFHNSLFFFQPQAIQKLTSAIDTIDKITPEGEQQISLLE